MTKSELVNYAWETFLKTIHDAGVEEVFICNTEDCESLEKVQSLEVLENTLYVNTMYPK